MLVKIATLITMSHIPETNEQQINDKTDWVCPAQVSFSC